MRDAGFKRSLMTHDRLQVLQALSHVVQRCLVKLLVDPELVLLEVAQLPSSTFRKASLKKESVNIDALGLVASETCDSGANLCGGQIMTTDLLKVVESSCNRVKGRLLLRKELLHTEVLSPSLSQSGSKD